MTESNLYLFVPNRLRLSRLSFRMKKKFQIFYKARASARCPHILWLLRVHDDPTGGAATVAQSSSSEYRLDEYHTMIIIFKTYKRLIRFCTYNITITDTRDIRRREKYAFTFWIFRLYRPQLAHESCSNIARCISSSEDNSRRTKEPTKTGTTTTVRHRSSFVRTILTQCTRVQQPAAAAAAGVWFFTKAVRNGRF